MTGGTRTILITGATGGLGRGLAHALATEPHRLILHGRDAERLALLRAELSELPGAVAAVDTVRADLAELSQVRALAEEVADLTGQVNVLVNNAGVGPGRDNRRETSADGFELRLAVNHLAPFALTLQLLPLLRRGAPARIVNVASAAQEDIDLEDLQLRHHYSGSRAYAQSKLAMIATGLTLAERLDPEEVTVNSLHPATLMPTAMVREGWGYSVDDLATGVAATRRLIDAPQLAGVSGRYFSGTRESPPLPQARDPQFRRRLWEISEELAAPAL